MKYEVYSRGNSKRKLLSPTRLFMRDSPYWCQGIPNILESAALMRPGLFTVVSYNRTFWQTIPQACGFHNKHAFLVVLLHDSAKTIHSEILIIFTGAR